MLGGYTACGIPLIRSVNGNRNGIPLNGIPFNGIPFPFVSIRKNFEGSVRFPFPLIALCFHVIGGYMACGIPLIQSANGNGNGIPYNGIPFPFVSVY